MKNINFLLIVSVSLLLTVSCSKDPATAVTSSKPTLTLSKTTVKIGEPVYAINQNKPINAIIGWSASNSGQVWASSTHDSATYLFTRAGSYQIKASYYFMNAARAYDSSSATVMVTDSIYNDTTTVSCDVIQIKTLLPNEQINLTPVEYSDTGLVFVAHTNNVYGHSPLLNSNGDIKITADGYEVDIDSTLVYPCSGVSVSAPAFGIVSLPLLTNGTHTLAVRLNGILYEGSFTVTDQNCTITWNHSIGVTISAPLILPKVIH
jgi:hypothetical protein